MGLSPSLPSNASKVPKGAQAIDQNVNEIVIRLRDANDMFKICAFLHQTGAKITAANQCQDGKCFVWVEKTTSNGGKLPDDLTSSYDVDISQTSCPRKGTHRICFDQCTYTQLLEIRKQYETQGFNVSAVSPATQLATKQLYFDSGIT